MQTAVGKGVILGRRNAEVNIWYSKLCYFEVFGAKPISVSSDIYPKLK